MTTNAGAREMSGAPMGFGSPSNAGKGKEAIERMFSPEFRNRLDATINFNSLSPENIERAGSRNYLLVLLELNERWFLQLTVRARGWFAERGDDLSSVSCANGAADSKRDQEGSCRRELVFGKRRSCGKVEVDEVARS